MALHAIDGIPQNCQILHVEQEVVGDDTSVLQCVLSSDVERTQLLAEEAQLAQQVKLPLFVPKTFDWSKHLFVMLLPILSMFCAFHTLYISASARREVDFICLGVFGYREMIQ
jgi:hypothetical protein